MSVAQGFSSATNDDVGGLTMTRLVSIAQQHYAKRVMQSLPAVSGLAAGAVVTLYRSHDFVE